MDKHGPVGLAQNVLADLHNEIGTHTQQLAVKRGVMQRAQRETIRDQRFSARVSIRQNP
jgi:hypothetical protein